MNFWDLGMVSTGSDYNEWDMLDFQPSACPYDTSSQTFDTTYHQELLDKIFEVPVEEWSTYYKRIVPEMEYGLQISAQDSSGFNFSTNYFLNSSQAEFTNAGLKVESTFFDDNKTLRINQLGNKVAFFRTQVLQTSSSTKVTTEYDFNADAVSFTPTKTCQVFLVPALPYALSRFNYREPGGSSYVRQLNEFFYLLDRKIVIEPYATVHELNGISDFVNFENPTDAGSQDEFERFVAVADYMEGFTNARARQLVTAPSTWTDIDPLTYTDVLPGSYSFSPANPPSQPFAEGVISMQCSLNGNTANTANIGTSSNQIRLRAVIKQQGTFYYLWND